MYLRTFANNLVSRGKKLFLVLLSAGILITGIPSMPAEAIEGGDDYTATLSPYFGAKTSNGVGLSISTLTSSFIPSGEKFMASDTPGFKISVLMQSSYPSNVSGLNNEDNGHFLVGESNDKDDGVDTLDEYIDAQTSHMLFSNMGQFFLTDDNLKPQIIRGGNFDGINVSPKYGLRDSITSLEEATREMQAGAARDSYGRVYLANYYDGRGSTSHTSSKLAPTVSDKSVDIGSSHTSSPVSTGDSCGGSGKWEDGNYWYSKIYKELTNNPEEFIEYDATTSGASSGQGPYPTSGATGFGALLQEAYLASKTHYENKWKDEVNGINHNATRCEATCGLYGQIVKNWNYLLGADSSGTYHVNERFSEVFENENTWENFDDWRYNSDAINKEKAEYVDMLLQYYTLSSYEETLVDVGISGTVAINNKGIAAEAIDTILHNQAIENAPTLLIEGLAIIDGFVIDAGAEYYQAHLASSGLGRYQPAYGLMTVSELNSTYLGLTYKGSMFNSSKNVGDEFGGGYTLSGLGTAGFIKRKLQADMMKSYQTHLTDPYTYLDKDYAIDGAEMPRTSTTEVAWSSTAEPSPDSASDYSATNLYIGYYPVARAYRDLFTTSYTTYKGASSTGNELDGMSTSQIASLITSRIRAISDATPSAGNHIAENVWMYRSLEEQFSGAKTNLYGYTYFYYINATPKDDNVGKLIATPDEKEVTIKDENDVLGELVKLQFYAGIEGETALQKWENLFSSASPDTVFKIKINNLKRECDFPAWSGKQPSYSKDFNQEFVLTLDEFKSAVLNDTPLIEAYDDTSSYVPGKIGADTKITFDYTADMVITATIGGNKYEWTSLDGMVHDDASFIVSGNVERIRYISSPDAYAELKNYGELSDQSGNLSEDYEVMAGVPSTQQLYYAAGGSEFIVDISFEYSEDNEAVRSYVSYMAGTNCQFKEGDTSKGNVIHGIGVDTHFGGTYNCGHTWEGTNSCTPVYATCKCGAQYVTSHNVNTSPFDAAMNTATQHCVPINDTITKWTDSQGQYRETTGYNAHPVPSTNNGFMGTAGHAGSGCNHGGGCTNTEEDHEHTDEPCEAGTPCTGPHDWSITVEFTVTPHKICGPCCEHRLPNVVDTWSQSWEYDTLNITDVHVWQIDQAAASGLEEVIGPAVDNDVTYSIGTVEGTDGPYENPNNLEDGVAAASIKSGKPSIFYNIAMKNSNDLAGHNTTNTYLNQDGIGSATESSIVGRIRYSIDPEQHDTVYYNLGTRTNTCDGKAKTVPANVVQAGGAGHGEKWGKGFLYSSFAGTSTHTGHNSTAVNMGKLSAGESTNGESENFSAGGTNCGQTNFPLNTLAYLSTHCDGMDSVGNRLLGAAVDTSSNQGRLDVNTPEFAKLQAKRQQGVQATLVTDFLILQTSSGDQSVLYFDKKSDTSGIKTQNSSNGYIDMYNEDGTRNGATGQSYTVTAEAKIPTIEIPLDTLYYDNGNSCSQWTEKSINIGGYNGNYMSPATKFNGSGNNGQVATVYDNDPAGAITRPARPDGKLMLYSLPLNIIPTIANQAYLTEGLESEVFWANRLHWTDAASVTFSGSVNPLPKPKYSVDSIDKDTTFDFSLHEYTLTDWGQLNSDPEHSYQGYILDTKYTESSTKELNSLVIHSPISSVATNLISLPDERDQRYNTDSLIDDLLDEELGTLTCPGTAAECPYAVLRCTYDQREKLFEASLNSTDTITNSVSKNSLTVPTGWTASGDGIVGGASAFGIEIPMYSELKLTPRTSTKVSLEFTVDVNQIPTSGSPEALGGFSSYEVCLMPGGYLGFVTSDGQTRVSNEAITIGSHTIKAVMSTHNVDSGEIYVDGAALTFHKATDSKIDMSIENIGSYIYIGKSTMSNVTNPKSMALKSLAVYREAGSLTHTEDCYTTTYIHSSGLNAHQHTEDCISGSGDVEVGDVLKEFTYTGGVQEITLQPGTYLLEVWGAQGGNTEGGKGGYSSGTYTVTTPTKLYVVVGGQGKTGGSTSSGGYNGGGYTISTYGTGGGGATHIATSTGELKKLANNKQSVLIVAGGGGGYAGRAGRPGGNGGGASGTDGYNGCGGLGYGATQTAAGASGRNGSAAGFGFGGNQTAGNGNGGAGGGGGWYGGGAGGNDYSSFRDNDDSGGGGGSGYIGGVTEGTTTAGQNTGNGKAKITCLISSGYDQVKNDFENGLIGESDLKDIFGDAYEDLFDGDVTTPDYPDGKTWEFNYIKNGQSIDLLPGTYKLEAWGAQGGNLRETGYTPYSGSTYGLGGKGGYSTGVLTLTNPDTLYIYTGGKGSGNTAGYNGGGSGSKAGAGGGGATHIALRSGLLANLSTAKADILLVAGGGGGAQYGDGGSGGGANLAGGNSPNAVGGSSVSSFWGTAGKGGTLTSGYAFGKGGSSAAGSDGLYGGAGGGGYYGGTAAASDISRVDDYGGGGGSGYANTSLLTSISGSNGQRSGNGHARITVMQSGPVIEFPTLDEIKNVIEKIPEDSPLFNCDRTANIHVCDTKCKEILELNCSEPHHFGGHYDGDDICYQACMNDANHRPVDSPITNDGTFEPGNFINLDWGFQIYYANVGDFYQSNLHGILQNTNTKGIGYVNGMDTSEWTRIKEIRLPVNVIYKDKLYPAGTWITLSDKGEYLGEPGAPFDERNWSNYGTELYDSTFGEAEAGVGRRYRYNFYCVESNNEYSAAPYEVLAHAINAAVLDREAGAKYPTNVTNGERKGATNQSDHTTYNKRLIDVVGRIGNLALIDTGDYRFSNFFKKPIEGTNLVAAPTVYEVSTNEVIPINGAEVSGNSIIASSSGQGAQVSGQLTLDKGTYRIYLKGDDLMQSRLKIISSSNWEKMTIPSDAEMETVIDETGLYDEVTISGPGITLPRGKYQFRLNGNNLSLVEWKYLNGTTDISSYITNIKNGGTELTFDLDTPIQINDLQLSGYYFGVQPIVLDNIVIKKYDTDSSVDLSSAGKLTIVSNTETEKQYNLVIDDKTTVDVQVLSTGQQFKLNQIAIQNLAEDDAGWQVDGIVRDVDLGKQNSYLTFTKDIRGEYVSAATKWIDTYGHQEWAQTAQCNATMPLDAHHNNIAVLKDEGLVIGYDVFFSINTLGDYWSAASKLQVIPEYYGLDIYTGEMVPLDVYIKHQNQYKPVNIWGLATGEDKYSWGGDGSGYTIDTIYDNAIVLKWPDEKERRMVTTAEEYITGQVKTRYGVPTPITEAYTMGNSQFLSLGPLARTFIGGETTYGELMNYSGAGKAASTAIKDPVTGVIGNDSGVLTDSTWWVETQRWHLTNSLPSSSIFIEAGHKVTEEEIKKMEEDKWVIITALDIRAKGDIWNLQYDGENPNTVIVTGQDGEVHKVPFPEEIVIDGHTHRIPPVLNIYQTDVKAPDDIDIQANR